MRLDTLSAEDVTPIAGGDGPTLRSALQAVVTWGTSRSLREQVMTDCGFPLPEDLPAFLVVNQLVYRGIARPTELADAVDTTRSNMSKIVSRLEEAGLVFRATDPRDDRGVVIGLSREGRALGHRVVRAVMPNEQKLPGWSAEEIDTLERLLIKFAATIDALPGHPLTVTAGVTFAEFTEP
ncbi:MarR family winged helix-turn-helix transcriptional regulator [Streptomyces sp. NPDC002643]